MRRELSRGAAADRTSAIGRMDDPLQIRGSVLAVSTSEVCRLISGLPLFAASLSSSHPTLVHPSFETILFATLRAS